MLAPLHSCNNPGLWFSAFNCVKQWLPLSFSLFYKLCCLVVETLYSNLTYIIMPMPSIMLECVAHFYLDLHRIHTYLNYCRDLTESKIHNFSYNTMDRSHTLKHIMFIQ